MGLLSTTSKLKKDGIWSFGLPAGKTCPNAGACKAGCYAQAGRYKMGPVMKKREANYKASDSRFFMNKMARELLDIQPSIVRIHDSGDFYSYNYMGKWILIAREFPEILFYAYTKQIKMVRYFQRTRQIPGNLRLILSYGGTEDHLIYPEEDRHARVFETEEELDKAGYVNAMESDILALGENKKIGLVYHGVKKFKNTEWSKQCEQKNS